MPNPTHAYSTNNAKTGLTRYWVQTNPDDGRRFANITTVLFEIKTCHVHQCLPAEKSLVLSLVSLPGISRFCQVLPASKFLIRNQRNQLHCAMLGKKEMVGAEGIEPSTFWSRTKRATRLRYAPSWLQRLELCPAGQQKNNGRQFSYFKMEGKSEFRDTGI